jgi:flagellin-like hook-associated protein FlgL
LARRLHYIQSQLNNLQQYYDSVSVVRTQLGSLISQSQSVQSDLQSYELARASDHRAYNPRTLRRPQRISRTQTALQAAMKVGAKISQLSLLDYVQ